MAEKYINGKGKVFFAPFAAGTQNPIGYRAVGNAPELAIAFDVTYLDHYSSQGGIKVKDQSVPVQVNRSGSIMIDNISGENLAMLFFGTSATVLQTAATVVNEQRTVDALDRYIQLGTSALNPTGVRSVSAVVVTNVGGSTTYVAPVDYTVDLAAGIIYIPSTSSIIAGSIIEVDYAVAAKSMSRVISGSTPVEGAMMFKANNPAGENLDYLIPWVKITPNGDFNLISDEWLKLSFKLEVLKLSDREAVYVNGQPF